MAENRTDLNALGLKGVRLVSTDTGLVALPAQPVCNSRADADSKHQEHDEITVSLCGEQ